MSPPHPLARALPRAPHPPLPSRVRSYECLAGNNVITREVTLNVSRTSIIRSAVPAANITINGGVYAAPAEDM